ncbi:unnamed protein product [Peronospora belbahrii]|uniref:Uncharacterized protein n=1 Tax=Peronospora belbahrii TaxID=622444 RepID=A0AAU9L1Q0_9STRA|nr:unnamed protein product [Peronospora belbahrii]CAH0514275.1 unnamed protein product [Peronospora belbahrii]
MTHWWRRDELFALLQAWEQTLDAPRDRDELRGHDLERLYTRFNALRPRDGAPIALVEVEAQRQRLVRTFLFLRAFNTESLRSGRPTWFQLPVQQQDDLRCMNGRLGDLAVVAQDEFDFLLRICEESPNIPLQTFQASERPMADEMKAAAEALAGLPMFCPTNQVRPTLSPSLSPLSSPATKPSHSENRNLLEHVVLTKKSYKESDSDTEDTPPKAKSKSKSKMASKWSKRDEEQLISAWHEVVTSLADNGYAGSYASRNEGLRLNSLIHQRYVELCGDRSIARTNQSTGAKKHAIMMAFRSLRNVLRTLASLSERPNWFSMTPDERMKLQKMHGHHQEHACLIEKETYQQLGEIDRAQRTVLTPIANALRAPVTLDELLRRSHKKTDKESAKDKYKSGPPRGYVVAEQSSSDEDSSGTDASVQSGKSERSSQALAHRAARRPNPVVFRRLSRNVDPIVTTSPPKRRRTGPSDAKWVTRLLDAQTQRFESLLAEFQEERRQERQHNLEIILEALKLRNASAQKAGQPSQFAEALVEKQRQHMLGLFNQLQEERSQERDQARMLLRELGTSRLVSQDQEHKE